MLRAAAENTERPSEQLVLVGQQPSYLELCSDTLAAHQAP
jgi:hypothetical protein